MRYPLGGRWAAYYDSPEYKHIVCKPKGSPVKNVLFCVVLLMTVQNTLAQSSPRDNEKFKAADQAFNARKYDDAAKEFDKANKALGGHCSVCLLNAAYAYLRLGRRDEVIRFSAKALEAANTPEDKFDAYLQGSRMLLQIEPNRKELVNAEAEAQKAVELQPESVPAHIALAMALLRQNKDAEGIAQLKLAEARMPDGEEKLRVQSIIADPRRGRLAFAPEFTATTKEGGRVSLTDMKGKVVLLDFWATWCPPCRESVPEIKDLRKRYGSDRLIVLSVSADSKMEDWKQYTDAHDMTWLQSWDRRNTPSVIDAFGIRSFPTYIVLDGEGIVRTRVNGLEPQMTLARRLRGVLDQLLK